MNDNVLTLLEAKRRPGSSPLMVRRLTYPSHSRFADQWLGGYSPACTERGAIAENAKASAKIRMETHRLFRWLERRRLRERAESSAQTRRRPVLAYTSLNRWALFGGTLDNGAVRCGTPGRSTVLSNPTYDVDGETRALRRSNLNHHIAGATFAMRRIAAGCPVRHGPSGVHLVGGVRQRRLDRGSDRARRRAHCERHGEQRDKYG